MTKQHIFTHKGPTIDDGHANFGPSSSIRQFFGKLGKRRAQNEGEHTDRVVGAHSPEVAVRRPKSSIFPRSKCCRPSMSDQSGSHARRDIRNVADVLEVMQRRVPTIQRRLKVVAVPLTARSKHQLGMDTVRGNGRQPTRLTVLRVAAGIGRCLAFSTLAAACEGACGGRCRR